MTRRRTKPKQQHEKATDHAADGGNLAAAPSCYATRTNVGGYREDKKEAHARSYTYAKGKQVYLLWG